MDKKNYRFSMVATDSGKTRISCSRCRKKNMVCDKLVPSCTNCLKRGLNCSYPLRKQWTRRESKEFERKEKESKKRQKRIESDHGTKKKKLTESMQFSSSSSTRPNQSPHFEDISPSLSSPVHPDPMYDSSLPNRCSSETALPPFVIGSPPPSPSPSQPAPFSPVHSPGTEKPSTLHASQENANQFGVKLPSMFPRSASEELGQGGLVKGLVPLGGSPSLTSHSGNSAGSAAGRGGVGEHGEVASQSPRLMSDASRGSSGFSSFGFSRRSTLTGTNSLPPLKEVLESDKTKTDSEDPAESTSFSDSLTTSTSISNPFSSPTSYVSPSSPSYCPHSFGLRKRGNTHQLPLSPLSSLTISPPSQPFLLSSMMNSTFPPPSTVPSGSSLHQSASLPQKPATSNQPSFVPHLPPLLPSSSLSPPPPVQPSQRMGSGTSQMGFVSSSPTPFSVRSSLPRHASADTLKNADPSLPSPAPSPAPSSVPSPASLSPDPSPQPFSPWSSAPRFPPLPTPAENEVITAQEHSFFEEMGWLTLSKDKAPEPNKTTPTTAVVRASLSDDAYQTKLVENSTSPMVSMYFGAYRAPTGDICVQLPRFAAKNHLAQREFCVNTTKSLKGQYHPVSQRRVFEEMRSRYIAAPDQVVQEVRFGLLIDDKKGNWIEYATCANYFYGADGLLTYVTRTYVKCTPSLNAPSLGYLMEKPQPEKETPQDSPIQK